MSKFKKLTEQLREFICQDRIRREIEATGGNHWENLCTAMDVLEDTQEALDAFLADSEREDAGEMYLATYGVLEALYLQQDAIQSIGTALNLPQSRNSDLMRIRGYRNDLAGHPIRNDGDQSTNGIVRSNSTSKKVEYHKRPRRGGLTVISVDLVKEVGEQNRIIGGLVAGIMGSLNDKEMKHKEKFISEPLQSLFPSWLGYEVSKLYQAASSRRSPHWELAETHLNGILECIEKLEKELKVRGEYEVGENAALEIDETRAAIERLRELFRNEEDALGLKIFISFVEIKLKELKSVAKEKDEEYSMESQENGINEDISFGSPVIVKFVDPKII